MSSWVQLHTKKQAKDGIEEYKKDLSKKGRYLHIEKQPNSNYTSSVREVNNDYINETDNIKTLKEAKKEEQIKYKNKFDKEKLESLQEKMSKADEQNQKANEYQQYKDTKEKYKKKKEKHEKIDNKVKKLRQQKEDRIANADMPIDDLNIKNGKVYYEGVEFSELSSGEVGVYIEEGEVKNNNQSNE